MTHQFARLAFTDSVKAMQERYRTRSQNERLETLAGPNDALGPDEAAFIAERDSFYLATVSETGWPYVQHRGGPKGFLKVIDPHTLAFGDFRGNLQYVSVGNASRNDRVALVLMDYAHRLRLKVLGRMACVRHRRRTARARVRRRAAGLPGAGRARNHDRGRGVRLELSAAHHAPLYRGGDPGSDAAAPCAHRGAGGRVESAARRRSVRPRQPLSGLKRMRFGRAPSSPRRCFLSSSYSW